MKYFYNQNENYSYSLGMSISIDLISKRLENVEKVFISNKIKKNSITDEFIKLLKNKNIDYEYNDQIFTDLSKKENCYVITKFRKFKTELSTDKHIVIDMKLDSGDVGTILRTMASFEYYDLILIGDYDYFNLKTVRSSMGGIFFVNVKKYQFLKQYLEDYPEFQTVYINQNGISRYSSESITHSKFSLIFTEKEENSLYFFKKDTLDVALIVSAILYELK